MRRDLGSGVVIHSYAAQLSHHARDAARLVPWRGDPVLQIAARERSNVAGPHIGPGAAFVLGLAGRLASGAGRIGRDLEIAIVAADAIDGIFDRTAPRLDRAGAAHARHAAFVLQARRHLVLQPAGGKRIGRARIGEAPGVAVRVALAAGGADGRVAVADLEVLVVAAAAVVTGLRLRRAGRRQDDQRKHAP